MDPDTADKTKAGDTDGSSPASSGSVGSSATTASPPRAASLKNTPAGTTGVPSAVDASGHKDSALEKMIAVDEADAKNNAVVVPVFKVAVRLVKQTLWKDEVRGRVFLVRGPLPALHATPVHGRRAPRYCRKRNSNAVRVCSRP